MGHSLIRFSLQIILMVKFSNQHYPEQYFIAYVWPLGVHFDLIFFVLSTALVLVLPDHVEVVLLKLADAGVQVGVALQQLVVCLLQLLDLLLLILKKYFLHVTVLPTAQNVLVQLCKAAIIAGNGSFRILFFHCGW